MCQLVVSPSPELQVSLGGKSACGPARTFGNVETLYRNRHSQAVEPDSGGRCGKLGLEWE